MRHHLNGPLGMLAGFIVFSGIPVMVKLASAYGVEAPAAVLVRFGVGFLCVLALVTLTRQRIRTGNFRLLVLRGLFGGAAVLLFFTGVVATGAGLGTLLNYTHCIWGNVLAVLVLRQKPPRVFWLLLMLAVAGLYLVIDPRTSLGRPGALWGAVAGLLSGILGGAAILCIKQLRRTDGPLTIFFSFAVVGFLVSLGLLGRDLLLEEPATLPAGFSGPALGILLGMGLLGFAGQMLFTAGYKNTSIPLGTLLSLTVPVLAILNGSLFLGEPLSLGFVAGAALILTACVGVGLLEWGLPRAPDRRLVDGP